MVGGGKSGGRVWFPFFSGWHFLTLVAIEREMKERKWTMGHHTDRDLKGARIKA